MYHQNPRVRDAQNPYRTGVLIGNCWEDKFGMELATKPVSVISTAVLYCVAEIYFDSGSQFVIVLLTERWKDWCFREQERIQPLVISSGVPECSQDSRDDPPGARVC